MLVDKLVCSNNIGIGSVMEEYLNLVIIERFLSLENRLKVLEIVKIELVVIEWKI